MAVVGDEIILLVVIGLDHPPKRGIYQGRILRGKFRIIIMIVSIVNRKLWTHVFLPILSNNLKVSITKWINLQHVWN